ncbi:putative bifunctional diguanylate cyclase/phosphodiesterase [Modestobacter roseus]|uniref:PAS domain S-box-containing protein/diguanylate cyclase (GGDEF)-like protein n=1 Tax=Modestobacter roseus TaxID=1181884 RepID=A0A562IW87_9ACTN|nr:GGDEF domain-containing phosphodiesterase [Modestobacter roseus]MQA33404.1 EAL domain-containing protein [Modestobacter roseus]TWH75321.1 PAS domain S-box-containing protein/diguanylate cyclase (GGDEF)-like protein [Modestobacter roseus]
MTSGALAAPARVAAAPTRRAPAAPRLGRALLLAFAVTLATGVAGPLVGFLAPVAVNFAVIAGVTVLLARSAAASAHPTAWRWYAGSVGLGGAGSALAGAVMPWGQSALGSIPGQLLVVAAVVRLIDLRGLRASRAQLLTSLVLFVIADLLTVHTIYRLTIAGTGLLSPTSTISMFALLFTIAIGTGCSLLLVAASPATGRQVGLLVFAAQCCASVAAGFSSVAAGPGPLVYLACSLSVLGLCLLTTAGRADRFVTDHRDAPHSSSALGALLPHATAMVGGALLLASVPVTGTLTITGSVLGLVGLSTLMIHQAVSWRAQQRLTAELTRSEAYFRTLVRGSADPVVILDDELRVRWVSPAITDLLGLDPQRIVGLPIADAVHPDDAPALITALGSAQPDDAGTKTRTARIQHLDGRWRLIRAQVRDLRGDPDVGALVLYCRDVSATAPRPADADLTAFSTTDPATGLPNRSALTQRLTAALRDPATGAAALVVIGVDGLPPGGDQNVLRELTTRFSRALRGADWLARADADEFAVLVQGTISDAETVAGRLVDAVEPVLTGGSTVRLTAAAGVTWLPADADAGETLRRADLALRSARAAGPGRVRRHSDALRMNQDREEALRADLAQALGAGQLHLVYQPVVDLALHRTTSVEALLRWRHPVYGEVSPAEFVPLAEESALITDLGRWVLHQATATVAGLPHEDLAVAVNVSARHLRTGELVDDVLAALEESGLAASRLVLEITESVLLDDGHVVADLELLRRLGVRIAVDDFGTGWSSLAYLVGLPIDVLKMDRQFLADVEHDQQRRALCASVLHLGTSLGLAVVVEGVETPAELQLLRDMGHRFIQGYLLARPLPAAALTGALPGDETVPPLGAPVPAGDDPGLGR